ncbi:hypothetical protein KBY58_11140 [Cyanobium sp. HWJ4-Hawea]|uniref:hypothetical protein n=1 Tax=Cyanobium sp. HWJ4-Hawea TaxID=2823713 RepID=UPI0020CF0AA2|nr:hypothetical protein [Cyanobium sp. HWJ4-Hawea]MCP9809989.1 hypothetical protein [Cyanobium sp. HWJ4-Hawea]
MAEDNAAPRQENPARGGRPGGNREPGGFRIRLSDNEMRAARAVQEAFQLRSTVAALGLSIRTVAQLIEEGKLDELVAQQRSQAGPSRDGDDRSRDNRGPRDERRGRDERPNQGGDRTPKANPFARPTKPAAPVAAAVEESEVTETEVAETEVAENAPEVDTQTPISEETTASEETAPAEA